MKKLIMTCIVTLAMYSLQAQNDPAGQKRENAGAGGPIRNDRPLPPAEKRAEKMVEKMNNELKLSEDQKIKITSLATDHNKEMDKIHMKEKDIREQIKNETKTSRGNFKQGIQKVLTPEQFKIWEEKRKEMAQKRKGDRMPPPPEDMQD